VGVSLLASIKAAGSSIKNVSLFSKDLRLPEVLFAPTAGIPPALLLLNLRPPDGLDPPSKFKEPCECKYVPEVDLNLNSGAIVRRVAS
jgi:hypothetical protein